MIDPPLRALNRAKCALCNDIVSSYYASDEAVCRCGEVHVKGGELQAFKPSSGNWSNLIYVDDIGNKICIEDKDREEEKPEQSSADHMPGEALFKGRTKKEFIDEFESMIKLDAQLPNNAHIQQLTYIDLLRYMVVILDILKRDS
jgi:hypothetical protein